MKIVVIGGNGLIGSRLIAKLTAHGHEAIAASRSTGVNTLTGDGLARVFEGADVVVDVSNSPSFEEKAVLEFFQTSTGNLLAAEAAAGVRHHVALSIVGIERLPENGYFRAKIAQEQLIKASPIPYSIVRSTQFFEFVKSLADEATDGMTVRLAPVLFQPIAADDVASAVGRTAVGAPLNGAIEIAGPDQFRLDEIIRTGLKMRNDPREVVVDPHARYFGAELGERTLVPGDGAQLGETHFNAWLSRSIQPYPSEDPLLLVAEAAMIEPPALNLKENEFRLSNIPPGSALLVGDVAVFNVGGTYCATQSRCPHRQGPLSRGKLEGTTLTCPSHGAQFNVCTGEVLRGPATTPLKIHRVVVDGEIGRVEVSVLI